MRQYLFEKIRLTDCSRVLDVGSGTGVLEQELGKYPGLISYGIDIDLERVKYAQKAALQARFCCGDGNMLPFISGSFEAAICHYLFLWVKNPVDVLEEMSRVIKPGGYVVAIAEPDHIGRIDWPEPFIRLGEEQTRSFVKQGADIQAGRKLAGWFCEAGLELVEGGLMGGQWQPVNKTSETDMEWLTVVDDLGIGKDQVADLIELDRQARQHGNRILYVPVFYAIGRKY